MRRNRRSLLVAAAAGGGLALARGVAEPGRGSAADGDPVVAGGTVDATSQTVVRLSSAEASAFVGLASGSGALGVTGQATSTKGESAGVFGLASGTTGTNIGVVGQSKSSQGIGVRARAISPTGKTYGLYGIVDSPAGVGVYAESAEGKGVALRTAGRVRFSTAGMATIKRGKNSIVVAPGVAVTKSTKVLCTLQSSPGGSTVIQSIDKTVGKDVFAIVLTANATANTPVAWFVID